ncbi:MAG: universal stress protein [Acidobacteriota bacterium]|nr:universal stress protein [Acidobacteriota bacterium]
MIDVLVHIGDTMPAAEDITTAQALAGGLGATLHVIYTLADPLSAGWQSEMNAAGMPQLHEAMEAEARERLRPIFGADADAPTIQIRTGDPIRAIADYAADAKIDLIVVGLAGEEDAKLGPALLEATSCSVLAWRHRRGRK